MTQLVFDEATATQIEAAYFAGDAVRRRRIVREALRAEPGERLLDVGCGPGFYCVELADEVGSAGAVIGVDSSPAMLALAARRSAGYGNVDLRQAEANALPLEDGSVDALGEMHRVIRPGGRVVIWDIDWATVSLHSQDEARTTRVLRAWDEHLAHRSLPRTLAAELRAAGFDAVEAEAHAFATVEFDPDTYAYVLIPIIEAFVVGRNGLSEADAHAWAAEQRSLGERGEFYFASTQWCFSARKPT